MPLDRDHDITALNGADYNPLAISEEDFEALVESVRELGVAKPIIACKETIVAGHQRTRPLRALGIGRAPVYLLESDATAYDEVRLRRGGDHFGVGRDVVGEGDPGEAAFLGRKLGVLGEGVAAVEGEPGTVERKEDDLFVVSVDREAESIQVEALGAGEVADPEGDHADARLHGMGRWMSGKTRCPEDRSPGEDQVSSFRCQVRSDGAVEGEEWWGLGEPG